MARRSGMDVSKAQEEATSLRPLAERVMMRYPFVVTEVEHLATHSNVLYRVLGAGGEQMVLRIGTPHANSRSNIEIEVAWLDALSRDTPLELVRPIPTKTGSYIVGEYDERLGKERSCVLFSWVPGRPMGDGAGTFAYRMLGEMCAQLQSHGSTWSPPDTAMMRRWDEVFYYDASFDPVVIDDPRFMSLFNDDLRWLVRTAARLATSVIDSHWSSGTPQVVHGDLHEWNVHLTGTRLHAFDFEDVMFALPAQDVAICLYASRVKENKKVIREAFRRGYEEVLEWPVESDEQLDGFHAARQVMLMNYAARTLPTREAVSYFDQVLPWLAGYVSRYQ